MSIPAQYYDGRRPLAHEVMASAESGHLRLVGTNIDVSYPLEHVQVQPPLAGTPRLLFLPGGDTCVIPDQRACDELLAGRSRQRRGVEEWVDRLERKASYAVGALIIGAATLAAFIWLAIPFVADKMAQRLSPSLEASLGAQALAALDQLALSPTELESSRQAELKRRFDLLVQAAGGGMALSLAFRRSPDVGPNAFALPGGTVVILDELVEVAASHDEIAAVLCHEIGHVYGRHSTRSALQNAAAAVVLGIVLGDVTSLSAFAGAIPGVLLSNSYSREFEREADTYGVALMNQAGIPLESFSEILLRIDAEQGGGGHYPNFLASHPSTAERIKAARPPRQ